MLERDIQYLLCKIQRDLTNTHTLGFCHYLG